MPLTRSPFATVASLALAIFLMVVVLSGGVRTSLAVVFLMAVDVTLIVGRGGWSRRMRRPRRRPGRAPVVTSAPQMSISS